MPDKELNQKRRATINDLFSWSADVVRLPFNKVEKRRQQTVSDKRVVCYSLYLEIMSV